MKPRESWQEIADTLGFQNEEEMLKHLYIMQGFSLSQMQDILGFCVFSIRRRLIDYRVPLRGRGGPANRLGKRLLKGVADEELFDKTTPDVQIAAKYQVHISTIRAERKFREKEISNAVRTYNADKLPTSMGAENKDSYGVGSVLPSAEVPGVLPDEEEGGGHSHSG